jgi:hypothetical protein
MSTCIYQMHVRIRHGIPLGRGGRGGGMIVVPLGIAKAGFLSGCTVVLGIVAATEERSEGA